jgi:hypothetical protein
MMATKEMIEALDAEIARLQMARKLLLNGGVVAAPAPVPIKKAKSAIAKHAAAEAPAGRRVLSEEARERIAAAQRKRWAAAKKAAKRAAK